MELRKADILKKEVIGKSEKGNDIYHILTKGGFSIIAELTRGGQIIPLGMGSHPAFAMHRADQLQKIQWAEGLSKSDGANTDHLGNRIIESTPQKHYDLAKHYSMLAGNVVNKNNHMLDRKSDLEKHHQMLFYTDRALAHYKASGMSDESASNEHKKNIKLGFTLKDQTCPHDDMALVMGWQRKNGKLFPHGIDGLDKAEKLEKPYRSEAQRKWAHTEAGIKALGGEKAVEHWDKESKGKDLPEELDKGLKGDWQKEGMKFDHNFSSDKKELIVHAFDNNGKEAGRYHFSVPYEGHWKMHVEEAHTHPDHRRKGLATAAYQIAEKVMNGKITPTGNQQTESAKALWSQPNRLFGKSEETKNQCDVLGDSKDSLKQKKSNTSDDYF